MDKMIQKDPKFIFLQLAQNGAKLPTNFNIEVVKDPTLVKLNEAVRRIPKLVENIKISPICSKTQNETQNQHIENLLYRQATQIEHVVVAKKYQGNTNIVGKNPPIQNT